VCCVCACVHVCLLCVYVCERDVCVLCVCEREDRETYGHQEAAEAREVQGCYDDDAFERHAKGHY
jgi:hypothetical protein